MQFCEACNSVVGFAVFQLNATFACKMLWVMAFPPWTIVLFFGSEVRTTRALFVASVSSLQSCSVLLLKNDQHMPLDTVAWS